MVWTSVAVTVVETASCTVGRRFSSRTAPVAPFGPAFPASATYSVWAAGSSVRSPLGPKVMPPGRCTPTAARSRSATRRPASSSSPVVESKASTRPLSGSAARLTGSVARSVETGVTISSRRVTNAASGPPVLGDPVTSRPVSGMYATLRGRATPVASASRSRTTRMGPFATDGGPPANDGRTSAIWISSATTVTNAIDRRTPLLLGVAYRRDSVDRAGARTSPLCTLRQRCGRRIRSWQHRGRPDEGNVPLRCHGRLEARLDAPRMAPPRRQLPEVVRRVMPVRSCDGPSSLGSAARRRSGESRSMKRAAPRIVHLVPHTHWDREWYLPFQSFRLRLVELIDGLLDEMEADPRVRFTLDGQTATVDDYLEVRPENEQRVARLVAAGRLAVGPWRILMDEFLVSGETLVRNLEQGMRRATELGRVMEIGYLPDMFGHVAQMPQLLRRAGIEDALVWRGVPAPIHPPVFAWTAPDGSTVRCEYLLGGYGNGRDVLSLPDRIAHKLEVYVRAQLPAFGDEEILVMYGDDHSLPLPGYAGHVAAFNGEQDRYELRIATLAEYIAATRGRSLPERSWPGELRSGARANVLMGVTSHRIEVRQAAGRVERLLERVAEPLLALYGDVWPERLLDLAWRRVVENSAHDSICACSAEATVAQVQVRFAEAEQIARGVTERALAAIAMRVAEGAFVAVNPSPPARTDLVGLEVLAANSPVGAPLVAPDGSPAPTQDLGVLERVVDDVALEAGEVVPNGATGAVRELNLRPTVQLA